MAQNDAHLAGAGEAGREDELLLAHGKEASAHGARQERPADQREDDGDAEIDPDVGPVLRQGGAEGHPERDGGHRTDELDDALDQHVDYAAVEAGDAAEDDTKDEAERDTDQADRKRDAGSVDDAGEHVAAELIGAEQKYGGEGRLCGLPGRGVVYRFADAEEVAAVRNDPPELIGISFDPEADGVAHGFVNLELHAQGVGVAGLGEAINERCPLELAVVEEMEPLRRRVGEGDLVGFGIVGGQKLGEDSDQVEEDNDDTARDGHLVLDEAPPHHLQRRSDVDAFFVFLDREIGVGILDVSAQKIARRGGRRLGGCLRLAAERLVSAHFTLPSGCGDQAAPALCPKSACR